MSQLKSRFPRANPFYEFLFFVQDEIDTTISWRALLFVQDGEISNNIHLVLFYLT
jgi:hypothetical protein